MYELHQHIHQISILKHPSGMDFNRIVNLIDHWTLFLAQNILYFQFLLAIDPIQNAQFLSRQQHQRTTFHYLTYTNNTDHNTLYCTQNVDADQI